MNTFIIKEYLLSDCINIHFKNYRAQFRAVSVKIRHNCCENSPVKVWRRRKHPGISADSWEVSTALQTMITKHVPLS